MDKWLELNYLGLTDLIPLSTVPKINRVGYTSSGRKRGGVFSIVGGTTKAYFWSAIPEKETPAEGYYFVKKCCESPFT